LLQFVLCVVEDVCWRAFILEPCDVVGSARCALDAGNGGAHLVWDRRRLVRRCGFGEWLDGEALLPPASLGQLHREWLASLHVRHGRYLDTADRLAAVAHVRVAKQCESPSDPFVRVGSPRFGEDAAHGLIRLVWSARVFGQLHMHGLVIALQHLHAAYRHRLGAGYVVVVVLLVTLGFQRFGDVHQKMSSSAKWSMRSVGGRFRARSVYRPTMPVISSSALSRASSIAASHAASG